MMHYLSNMFLLFLMLIPHSNLVRGMYDRNAIIEDLTKFNITCEEESCEDIYFDSLSSRNCHCGIHCVQFGTCCYDSNYAGNPQPHSKPSCRVVHGGDFYFMVDRCPSSESMWAHLCNTERDSEDDLQSIIPVTSLSTSVTYKNYYCFRCHETTEDFLYWTAKLESHYEDSRESPPTSMTYNKDSQTWMVSYEDTDPFPVQLSITFPNEISNLAHICVTDVISNCSTKWSDEDIRNKCQSYMALRNVQRLRDFQFLTYKNIHCALCNFENLTDISCKETGYGGAFGFFSFTHLLDINRSDGELVGKIKRCSEDHLWDPYTWKCRELACALPGYKVKNGKCVQG